MTDIALPVLTFPDEVAAFVRENYERAEVIWEYGSGGSTFVAARLPGKTIVTVESDPGWAARMKIIANAYDLPSPPSIRYHDIGPVGRWARALDGRYLDRFFGYAQSLWDDPDLPHPDLILIDGRFRASCFMAALLNAKRPVLVLFDDYKKRPEYHVIERLSKKRRMVGRMAVFDITPQTLHLAKPWLILAPHLDAVCSFRVGVAAPRRKLEHRLRDKWRALLGWLRRIGTARE